MGYWLAGEKCDDLLRKSANMRGKKWGKEEIFMLVWGKKFHFGKMDGGWAKITIFLIIYNPVGCSNNTLIFHVMFKSVHKRVYRLLNNLNARMILSLVF